MVSQPQTSHEGEKEKRFVALTSVIAAVFLTVIKMIVGFITGSLGIVAEAAHSGLDLIAALVTYLAVRVSDKPADTEHHYGHGKVENISALAETLLLLITCVWIIYEAIHRLLFHKFTEIDAGFWAFAIMIISIIINISRERALTKTAQKYGSQALEADALHFKTDIWGSAVVIVGLICVQIGERFGHKEFFARGDALAALGVAAIVIWVGVSLGKRTVDALLDRAPVGFSQAIRAAVRQVDGVLDLANVRVRRAGNTNFVDLTVAVGRNTALEPSHRIAISVEEQVRKLAPYTDVIVHIEPILDKKESVIERIRAVARNLNLNAHHISIHELNSRFYVELDMEVAPNLTLQQAHAMANQLEQTLQTEIPAIAEINTRLESRGIDVDLGADITAQADDIVRQARQIAIEHAGVKDCHKVTVRRSNENLFLILHCTFDEQLSIREVEEASSGIEERLMKNISCLQRVLVHAEPVHSIKH
ncbi:MAG: cation-efflux pump [Candidatus Poribacteria bacterium]